jgi:nitrogen regulatory protein PII
MHIVPEKEMLMMVVPSEKKDDVLKAIKELPCLQQPGSGIAFCSGVDSFDILGKK